MGVVKLIALSLLFHFTQHQGNNLTDIYEPVSNDDGFNDDSYGGNSTGEKLPDDYSYNNSTFSNYSVVFYVTPLLKETEKKCAEDPTTNHQCGCDPDCAKYGDCCPDSVYFKAEEQKLGVSTASCHTKFATHFYVMTRCPSTWEDSKTRHLCEHPDPTYPNPMLDTFITSLRTNVTYRNSYCATCHGDLHQDTFPWPFDVFCGFDRYRVPSLSLLEYSEHMVYDETIKRWYFDLSGLEIDRQCVSCTISLFEVDETYSWAINCSSPSPVYFPNDTKVSCRLIPKESSSMLSQHRLRFCKKAISTCAKTWTDATEREKCEEYMAQVNTCNLYYRNYHCALCNYVERAPYTCVMSTSIFVWSHAFSELLHKFGVVCGQSKIFDTLSRQCINVLPHQEGWRKQNGSCTNITFSKEEYRLSEENKTVYIPSLRATYYQHQFFILDDQVVLCVSANLVKQFAPELRYITIIGLSLSITCILLHLAVLYFIPSLVNLPALNLASLCVSLLLLYFSFIANGTVDPGTTSCVVIGVVTHYSLLASFSWMFIISFDIFYMTRRTQTKLIALKGIQKKRFMLYSAIGWTIPGLVSGCAVLLDYVTPNSSFAPSYKAQRCWFSRPNGLLLFCITPLVVVMSLNIAFFLWTSYLIHKMRQSSKSAVERSNFWLHLRLFVIMGLTWITGLTATTIEVKVLWHFFVAFNTMQGVFIFIMFTCTGKVLKEVKGTLWKDISFKSKTSSGGNNIAKTSNKSE